MKLLSIAAVATTLSFAIVGRANADERYLRRVATKERMLSDNDPFWLGFVPKYARGFVKKGIETGEYYPENGDE